MDDRPQDHEAIVRSMIQHENELRHQRLGYLLTVDGFLFAALAFAWDTCNSWGIVIAVAGFGLVVSIATAAGQGVSSYAIEELRTPFGNAKPPVVGATGDDLPRKWWRWFYPWRLLPWVSAAVWVAVLIFYFVARDDAAQCALGPPL